ncbi:hypothetical protein [Novosphingobium rosa]|uniref:hypothetical protein n=1 Tax=Novosphingobium rosa TaxID=76978 RepID=UPI00082E4425|nr:hypothetical protein [Novosphingobium rosa]
MFSWFLTYSASAADQRVSDADKAAIAEILRAAPGIERAHIFTPTVARDKYFDDGPSPMLTLQLFFPRLETLEAAASRDGALSQLDPAHFASLNGAQAAHQAMWTRPYPTPSTLTQPAAPPCSYLVHYPGHADNLNDWLRYYLAHHPQVMHDFPGIREIEIFTRVDWAHELPWPVLTYMQRNKLVFDSAEALETALHSPVREEMKADRAQFPPFEGGNIHYPMVTETVVGPALVPMAR